jgi:hypothetical protein
MNQPKAVIAACQVLRARVRFARASFTRPGEQMSDKEYSDEIREATRLHVETWIVPLLDTIERGDLRQLAYVTSGEPRQEMDSKTGK